MKKKIGRQNSTKLNLKKNQQNIRSNCCVLMLQSPRKKIDQKWFLDEKKRQNENKKMVVDLLYLN